MVLVQYRYDMVRGTVLCGMISCGVARYVLSYAVWYGRMVRCGGHNLWKKHGM